jgi:antitoxin component HigA of HigAB toxin-antitoxin module
MIRAKRKRNAPDDAYLDLVREFPLKEIRTVEQQKAALKMSARFVGRPSLSDDELDYMRVLLKLIQDFGKSPQSRLDTSRMTAADIVSHLMEENRLTISGLARELGIGQSNLSEMLSGVRSWNIRTVKLLCDRFALKAELFL